MEVNLVPMGEAKAKKILEGCANDLAQMPFDELTTFEKNLLREIVSPEDFKRLKEDKEN